MYVKTNNKSGCWLITKMVYFAYILYWAWGLEAFQQIGGYLIPLGIFMAGLTMINYFSVDQRIAPLFPFPIKMWLAFGLSEVPICFVFAFSFHMALSQLMVFIEIIIVLVCIMAISILEKSVSFVVNVNRVVYAIYAISMLFLAEYKNGRLTLYNSNTDATVCLAGIVLTLLSAKLEKRFRTVLDFAMIAFFFYCILQTGSRKALIAATLFIVLWMIFMSRLVNSEASLFDNDRKYFYNTIAIVIAIVILIFGIPFISSSYAFRKILSGGDETSDGYRILLYKEAWGLFKSYPVFGVGYGLFQPLSSIGRFSHSTYAEMLSCCGLYGVLMYFAPYFSIAKNLKRCYTLGDNSELKMKSMTFFLYFVIVLFLGIGMIHFYNEKFMVMFGIMVAFTMIEGRKEEDDKCQKKSQACSYIRG